MTSGFDSAAEVRALLARPGGGGAAFQSILLALAQALARALRVIRRVAASAISLAHKEKLQRMVEELGELYTVLQDALSEQGQRLLEADVEEETPKETPAATQTWWFALSEAIAILEEDASWIESLVSKQPADAPSRLTGEVVVGLLGKYHDQLLVEADRWMS